MHLSTPLRGTGCNFVYAYLNGRLITEIDQNYSYYFDARMLINWTKAQFRVRCSHVCRLEEKKNRHKIK